MPAETREDDPTPDAASVRILLDIPVGGPDVFVGSPSTLVDQDYIDSASTGILPNPPVDQDVLARTHAGRCVNREYYDTRPDHPSINADDGSGSPNPEAAPPAPDDPPIPDASRTFPWPV